MASLESRAEIPMPRASGEVPAEAAARLEMLRREYALSGKPLLEVMIKEVFPGRIAVVSSFGSESVVLLHMVSEIDPSVPVIFLNTGKLFPETLRYRDLLQDRLGLTDLRSIGPDPVDRARLDSDGSLWSEDPDACCHFRKVLPLRRALGGFEAVITGRKRFQTASRAILEAIEFREMAGSVARFSVNPLVDWDQEALGSYVERHSLAVHPLVKRGYLSIGCVPCTASVGSGGSYRDGRWGGLEKEECGIHGGSR